MFEIEPDSMVLFGIPRENADLKDSNFVQHAKHYVRMVSQALELLGPDVELLTDILVRTVSLQRSNKIP